MQKILISIANNLPIKELGDKNKLAVNNLKSPMIQLIRSNFKIA